jgi:hypothetical protein
MPQAHGTCQICGSTKLAEAWARVALLEETLRTVREAIVQKAGDTFWLSSIETVVDRIDTTLAGEVTPDLFIQEKV